MKIILSSIALIILFSKFSFSQHTDPTAEQKAKQITAEMKSELNLSSDQEQRLYKINLNLVSRRNQLVNDTVTSSEVKGKAYSDLKKLYFEQIDSVLTPQQQDKRKSLSKKNTKKN